MGEPRAITTPIYCGVDEMIHANSDHLLICTIINVKTPLMTTMKRRNWKTINTPKFIKFVEENLGMLHWIISEVRLRDRLPLFRGAVTLLNRNTFD
jgi:hypothetical protein